MLVPRKPAEVEPVAESAGEVTAEIKTEPIPLRVKVRWRDTQHWGITDPDEIERIRARVAYTRLSRWQRLRTPTPPGWP